MGSSIRLTGMASGLDTDSIVEQLMNVEKQSYYKAQREQYKTEYKIEKYREVTTKLTDFNSKYLDSLSSTNMKSATFFRKFKTTFTSSLTGVNSNAVSITSTSEANAGTHQVTIKQVAQAASVTGVKSTGNVKIRLTGENPLNLADGTKISMTIDGKTREIDISGNYDSENALKNAIEEKIKDTFGVGYDDTNGKVGVSIEDGMISLSTKNGASNLEISADAIGLSVVNSSSSISLNSTLETLKNSFSKELEYGTAGEEDDEADQISFKINGKEFTFDKEDTLKEIINTINNDDDLGVTMSFNSTTGKFSITTDKVGADEVLNLEDTNGSNFFETIGLLDEDAVVTKGQDTMATVDGIEVVRASKTFTVDGITYQANEVTAEGESVTINLDIDTDKVFDDIKSFVNDYNELVDYLTKLINEEYDRDYQPLTDDERAELSEDEIKKWDEKAKTGLLHNDSTIRNLLNALRSQFSGTVQGVGTTFSDIGIKTGTYTNGGKIILDDDGITKLKSAISNNLDDVVALFTQKSVTYSAASSRSYTFDEKTSRKQEEGLMNRFYDTLEDYISTYRDTNNAKGLLLEKAGKVGDTTETTSTLSKQLIQYTKKVQELMDKVNSKYDKYYKQFSALETAMNSLNSQSSYISQMLGGMGMQ